MDSARFSNFTGPDFDPQNIRTVSKGSNGIAVMALAYNEPKGKENLGRKVFDVVAQHYMRRPSLKDESLQKITEFAHDAICVQQAPGYEAECDTVLLMTQGSKFRWVCTGGARIFYFVNGQVMDSSDGKSPRLGSGREKEMPEGITETEFTKGENSFLMASENFWRVVSEAEMENALTSSENAEEWLDALKALYEDRSAEPYALMTIFMPQKRKRLPKKAVIAIIIAAVLLIGAAVFFAMGARKRGQEGGNRPPKQEQGEPGQPGQKPTKPPKGEGMEGEEPTEPPAPGQGGPGQGGEGGPGQKPTKPPMDEGMEEGEEPTEPPAPSEPTVSPDADATATVSPEQG